MEEYVKSLQEYLEGKRNFNKTMFKVAGTIYRGVNKNRFTIEKAFSKLNNRGE